MVTRRKRRNRPAVLRFRERTSAKTLQVGRETLDILTAFAKITRTWVQHKGNAIRVIAETRTILAKAQVNDTFPCDFAIPNLAQFVRLAADRSTVTFFADRLVIAETTIPYCDRSSAAPQTDAKIPVPSIEFSLAKEALKEVLAKAAVLRTKHVVLIGDGQRLLLKTQDGQDTSKPSHELEIGPTRKRFAAVFKLEHIKALLVRDYWVRLSGRGICHFACPNLEYFIATDQPVTGLGH